MNAVRELRKMAGIQQKELAIAVGVSAPTVSEWEHGKKDPTGDRVTKLAEFFNVSPAVILCFSPLPGSAGAKKEDADVMEIREQLRRDPNTRMLFYAAKTASPEHIRAAAAMLKALEPEDME